MKMFWRKLGFLFLVILLSVTFITGCSVQSNDASNHQSQNEQSEISYPMTVKDSLGNEVTIPKEPERIVSLIPSNTEILFALELGEKVVGVTTNDNYPEEVKNLPKVGDYNINVEKVVELKPDLVVAQAANEMTAVEQIKQLNIPVLILDAQSVDDVYKTIRLVAQVTNRQSKGEQVIEQMEKKKNEIIQKVSDASKENPVKVWIELDSNLFTVGGDGFLNELVELAGGENVAKDLSGWPQISSEQVVKWNPDVILSAYGGEKEILTRKGWENVNAIKNQRVYSLDPDLSNRPGPRIIDGVEEIAKYLYPEQFQ